MDTYTLADNYRLLRIANGLAHWRFILRCKNQLAWVSSPVVGE